MIASNISNLLKHEFSQSPDLFSVLGVIHNVVLHEKGLRGSKMQDICYVCWVFGGATWISARLTRWISVRAHICRVDCIQKCSQKRSKITSHSNVGCETPVWQICVVILISGWGWWGLKYRVAKNRRRKIPHQMDVSEIKELILLWFKRQFELRF